jgi:host factor-I protein
MSNAQASLQDQFLNNVRKEGIGVVLYLEGGIQIRGYVKAFDNFTVLLENNGRSQLVYKHAITHILPVKHPGELAAPPREAKERKPVRPTKESTGEQ